MVGNYFILNVEILFAEYPSSKVVLVVQRFGVRHVIERSLVRLPAGALPTGADPAN